MFSKIYWVHQFNDTTRLGIMARPRGDDWLHGEIAHLKKQNVGLLVSLLEKEEIKELGLSQQERVCKSNGVDFFNFPIADRDIPKPHDKKDWFISYLTDKLQNGVSVVIHCRMGIGRSSIIAASILIRAGLKPDTIIEEISKIRGVKVPDTDAQLQWIKSRK